MTTSKIEAAIERYESLIEQKDERISQLESELKKERSYLDCEAWSRPREEKESDLPVPRLQIVLTVINEWHHNWFYTMVYRHTLGYLVAVPMGETDSQGGHHFKVENAEDAHSALPFRDGTHIRRDSHQLNLPAYAIIDGKSYFLEPISKQG